MRERLRSMAEKLDPVAMLLAALSVILVAANFLFAPPLERAEGLSPLVLDHEGRWLHAYTTEEGRWRFGADLDAIDPTFVERLIAIEDKRFFAHRGVDAPAVLRAGLSALKAGKIVSGASTITMQTARLLEPRPRTIPSKLIEMIRARQIEERLSKREILQLYLTLAPYGGNLEGVRAASLSYFGKEPRYLNDAEQALLIALPQAPEARRPDIHAEAAKAARAAMLARFVEAGLLSPQRAKEGVTTPLPAARLAMPAAAYHLTRELAAGARKDGAAIVRSSLDLRIQKEVEARLSEYAGDFKDGATAALIVVDNRTRAVRALVGSSGTDVDGGWIDLTRALRSPGSTLKPFIYGLAFDDGLIGPDSLIEDMPQSFNGYAPENFDRTFRGEVKAADALQHSLNLPAVRLLDRLGTDRLAAVLRAAGIKLAGPERADSRFGLTLALGGAGVSMRDLAALYTGLANDGAVAPLVWREEGGATKTHPYQMLSPESAARISAILADAPSLAGRAPSTLAQSAPRISFKTGTSYGYRDAWAAGHDGAYTVAVWVGRADGAPRPGETGRKAAAPLLMEIFDALTRLDPDAPERPDQPAEDRGAKALARLDAPRRESPPEITFPRNSVELYGAEFDAGGRGYALAARGGAGDYRWYVGGDKIEPEAHSGRAIWRPSGPGFYDVVVVDAAGRSANAKVKIAVGG